MPFPGAPPQQTAFGCGAGPSNIALLTDGTVLASDSPPAYIDSDQQPLPAPNDTSNKWYVLTPDVTGSYANGTWAPTAPSSIGRWGNMSFVLKDGRYLICGGEYVSERYEMALHDAQQNPFARCEIYDPTIFSWTAKTTLPGYPAPLTDAPVPDYPVLLRDTPAVELPDGGVMALEASAYSAHETNILTYNSVNATWGVPQTPYLNWGTTEGDCILQNDGSVFCGLDQFGWFFPGLPIGQQWVPSANPSFQLNSPAGSDEQGPMLLLYPQDGGVTGQIMVLGSNNSAEGKSDASAPSGRFTPPPSPGSPDAGTWQPVAPMPTNPVPFDHGDAPAAVMRDGKVLAMSRVIKDCNDVNADVLHEYDPSADTWTLVPSFPGSVSVKLEQESARMLDLPNGQVLVTGTSDGSMWLYTPSGTPQASWLPTITAISGPVASGPAIGTYTLTGTQLNGLTNGANYGDDAKMATTYPIVSLLDGSGHVYYARTSNFSSMVPAPNATGSCSFTLPTSIPNGTYTVQVSASGVPSDPTPNANNRLTVSGNHVAAVTVSPSNPLLVTVTLSQGTNLFSGQTVNLWSSDPSTISVPPSITIPSHGKTTASFTATMVNFGSAIVYASTSPSNSQFRAASAQMGWTIQSLTGPSVIYGDRGAATTLPWTVTFSPSTAPVPVGATLNLSSSNLNVATVPSSVQISSNPATFNVTKAWPGTGSTRGLSTITAWTLNPTSQAVPSVSNTRTFTFSDRDTDFYKCAIDGGSCASGPSPKLIAYGANGVYIYRRSTGEETPCNAIFFGASIPSAACYVSTYAWLADDAPAPAQNQFTLTTPVDFAYGLDTGYSYTPLGPVPQTTCGNSMFSSYTDPVPGYSRSCFAGPDPVAYVYRGGAGATFTVPASTPLAVGGAGHFTFSLASGPVTCSGPCYTLKYHTRVADENEPLNLPVGTLVLYGSGLNGNFLINSTNPGATCSNSYFAPNGGDPDPGEINKKHCWIQDAEGFTKGDGNGNGLTDIYLVGSAWGDVPVAENIGGPNFGTFNCDTVSVDSPTFTDVWAISPNAKVLAGDFNGDRVSDLALVGSPGWEGIPVARRMAPGAGFSITAKITSGGPNGISSTTFQSWAASPNALPVAGDFNGDGLTDIALTGGPSWTTLPVAFSNGDGTFNMVNNPIDSSFYGSAEAAGARPVVGDFNGDGFDDIAIVGFSTSSFIPIALSNGDGYFTARYFVVSSNSEDPNFTSYSTTPGVQVMPGDFNGDGLGDIALTGGPGWSTIPVAFANSNGTFSATNYGIAVGDGAFPAYAATPGVKAVSGDFNNDGESDIALTGGPYWSSIPVAFSNPGAPGTWDVTNTWTQGLNFPSQASVPGVQAVGGGY